LNKPASGLWFVEQKLGLSSSFRCDQIYNYELYYIIIYNV
jgi:hypothetical protein